MPIQYTIDDELTMLWGQVPPRFQSTIHNHAVFANIAPFYGSERNTIYEEQDREEGTSALKVVKTVDVEPGDVLELAPDAIHCIENLSNEPARAFHCYGGNFKALDDQRDLWSWTTKQKIPFSLPAVMKESITRMQLEGNRDGLEAVVDAIPQAAPLARKALQEITE